MKSCFYQENELPQDIDGLNRAQKSIHGTIRNAEISAEYFLKFVLSNYAGQLFNLEIQLKAYLDYLDELQLDGKINQYFKRRVCIRLAKIHKVSNYEHKQAMPFLKFIQELGITHVSEEFQTQKHLQNKLLSQLDNHQLLLDFYYFRQKSHKLDKYTGTIDISMRNVRLFLRFLLKNKIDVSTENNWIRNAPSLFTYSNVTEYLDLRKHQKLSSWGDIKDEDGILLKNSSMNDIIKDIRLFFKYILSEKVETPAARKSFIDASIEHFQNQERSQGIGNNLFLAQNSQREFDYMKLYRKAEIAFDEYALALKQLANYSYRKNRYKSFGAKCHLPQSYIDKLYSALDEYLSEINFLPHLNDKQKVTKHLTINRLKTAITLGLEIGLRVSTVEEIHVEDIDFDRGILHLRFCKGYDAFEAPSLPLNQVSLTALKKLISLLGIKSGSLFSKRSIAVQLKNILSLKDLRNYTDQNGNTHEITFHYFRYTFGANRLAEFGDIAIVSKLLSHRDISITSKVYLDKKIDDTMRNIYNKNHDNNSPSSIYSK
ncbi:tyrosine-type recombinase/integrase [Sediminitomix flava]|uniref:tyrosine-type recombinase/integrase n=1 Tax=Sediminitomix flava TaxID=379075 RepID=UPI001304F0E7|nr:tyrosine-type recombinase/integrase [Sediminitomix flava]